MKNKIESKKTIKARAENKEIENKDNRKILKTKI